MIPEGMELAQALREVPDLADAISALTVQQRVLIEKHRNMIASLPSLFQAIQAAPTSATYLWERLAPKE